MKRKGSPNDYAGRSGKCRSGVSTAEFDNTRGFRRQMDEEIEVGGDVRCDDSSFPVIANTIVFCHASARG